MDVLISNVGMIEEYAMWCEGPIRRPETGSEWEPIKILWKKTALVPKSHTRIPTRTCQDHIVTRVLLTLGARLKRLRSKAEANTEKDGPKKGYQTHIGSSGINLQITQELTEPYRVTRPLPPDHPTANSAIPGHPSLTSGSSGTTQKIASETTSTFRSMDLPNRLECWYSMLGRWWAPQREDMAQKFCPQAPYNSRNHKSWPRTLWTRIQLKINKLKAKSGIWGV
jgi:hypothetical protein